MEKIDLKLTYEMSVDSHFDNFYIVKREGMTFAHIFMFDEVGKKRVWSVWVGSDMVVKKDRWNDAWNWIKAREGVSVTEVEVLEEVV